MPEEEIGSLGEFISRLVHAQLDAAGDAARLSRQLQAQRAWEPRRQSWREAERVRRLNHERAADAWKRPRAEPNARAERWRPSNRERANRRNAERGSLPDAQCFLPEWWLPITGPRCEDEQLFDDQGRPMAEPEQIEPVDRALHW